TNVLVIIDNDSYFSFSQSSYVVNESAGNLTVTVFRVGQNARTNVTVAYATVNGTATAPSDFIGVNQTLTFPPGVTNQTFNVPIINDTLAEGNETFTLTLSLPQPTNSTYLGTNSVATVTIVDDDIGLHFSASAYGVSKTNATAVIPVLRLGVTNANVTVSYVVTNGTATNGLDFFATNGLLSFPSGVNTNFITVRLINNTNAIGNKTVNLYLTNASGIAMVDSPSNAVLTILDAPGALTFAQTNFSVSEASTNAVITVARIGGSSGTVGVTAFTAPGTASSGLDYVDVNVTLTWTNGDVAPKTFLVPIVNDQIVEPAETINLYLTNATGFAVIATGTATITIIDNDGPGGVDFNFNTGTGFNNSVFSVLQLTNGQLVAGGAFTSYNGSVSNATFVARLNLDGSLDTNFNRGVGPDNVVRAVVLQPDGKLLIGGDFTSVNGIVNIRNRIARLNSDGSVDTTFVPNTGANSSVFAVALQTNGQVLIAGSFTNVSGTARSRVARLNSSGSLDSTFTLGTGPNNTVSAMALQPDGRILIGGSFTNYNGTGINRLVRLTSSGALDASFNPGAGPNNTVFAIAVQGDGKILVGGLFTTISGQNRFRIARLNSDGSLDSTFNITLDDAVLSILPQADGKILLAGAFTMFNGSLGLPPAPGVPSPTGGSNVFRVCRLNSDVSLDTTFNSGTGANNLIYTITLQSDAKVVLGGDFTDNVHVAASASRAGRTGVVEFQRRTGTRL
ncbi:MAG: hypothetical protein HY300_08880, partial [Verrucomicrobia bacterium]|nr:hypothetical protein [Verrucomicrobiota bacterium]